MPLLTISREKSWVCFLVNPLPLSHQTSVSNDVEIVEAFNEGHPRPSLHLLQIWHFLARMQDCPTLFPLDEIYPIRMESRTGLVAKEDITPFMSSEIHMLSAGNAVKCTLNLNETRIIALRAYHADLQHGGCGHFTGNCSACNRTKVLLEKMGCKKGLVGKENISLYASSLINIPTLCGNIVTCC